MRFCRMLFRRLALVAAVMTVAFPAFAFEGGGIRGGAVHGGAVPSDRFHGDHFPGGRFVGGVPGGFVGFYDPFYLAYPYPYTYGGSPAYFCPPANAYYPYVASCPVPWQVVPAS